MTFLLLLKSLAKKIPWQVWACTGAALIFFGWGEWRYHQGASKVKSEWNASVERGKNIVKELKSRHGMVFYKVLVQHVEKVKVIKERGATVEKLIPVYLPSDDLLPGGFRVLHDAAATNTVPGTTEGADAQPVPIRQVASTVNKNYTTCHLAIQELYSLRQWVVGNRQAYLDLCKQQGADCN